MLFHKTIEKINTEFGLPNSVFFNFRIESKNLSSRKNLLFFKKNLMPRRSLSVVFDGVFTALLAVSCG